MKEIPLTRGASVKVDDEDYVRLKIYSWCLGQGGYAVRGGLKSDNQIKRKNIRIHRQILDCLDSSLEVDHINGDRLDCRKENLRLVTSGVNQRNKVKRVLWDKGRRKWKVSLRYGDGKRFMKRYDTFVEAEESLLKHTLLLQGITPRYERALASTKKANPSPI